MKLPRGKQNGFSLIELIVAVSLSVMLLLTASAMFMVFLVSSNQANNARLVRSEGQYALSQMEFLLRNAVELMPLDPANPDTTTCEPNMNSIKFTSIDGGETILLKEDDDGHEKIASNSGIYLTSSAVELVEGPTFSCSRQSFATRPHINISFTLKKSGPGVLQNREIIQEFTTSTTIRTL